MPTGKKIPKEKIQQVIDLYKSGKSIPNCEKITGVSKTSCQRILKKQGVIREKNTSLPKKLEIINFYLKGNSHYKISKEFNISRGTSLRILKEFKIKRRNFLETNRIYKRNSNYFENIDTKDKAYFLGWMTSDGCNKTNAFALSIQEEDGYILEKFKKYMEYEGGIINIKPSGKNIKNQKCLSITDSKICQDLYKHGVIPAKSHKTYFPEIPEHLWNHFIRGVFDGDGCIYKGKNNSFNIIGNIKLIEKIQEILMKECNLSKTKLHHDKKHTENIVTVRWGGNKQIKKIYNYLYKDCDDLYLKRKKEKFELL